MLGPIDRTRFRLVLPHERTIVWYVEIKQPFRFCVLKEEDPHALAEAHHEALAKGPAWRDAIIEALKRLPETARQR